MVDDVTTLFYQARQLKAEGRYREAIRSYEAYLRARPNDTVARYNLATALWVDGRRDDAERLFRETIWKHPADPMAYLGLGLSLEGRGDAPAAIEQYLAGLRADPVNITRKPDLGRRLLELGSEATLRELVQLCLDALASREDTAVREIAAASLARLEDWEASAREYQAVVEREPHNFNAMLALAETLTFSGQYQSGEKVCRAALDLRPDDPKATLQLANILSRLHRNDEAVALCSRVAQSNPQLADAHYYLGYSLYERFRETRTTVDGDEARTALQRAVELDPDRVGAILTLAHLEWDSGHRKRSMDLLSDATARHPSHLELWKLLLHEQLRAGHWMVYVKTWLKAWRSTAR